MTSQWNEWNKEGCKLIFSSWCLAVLPCWRKCTNCLWVFCEGLTSHTKMCYLKICCDSVWDCSITCVRLTWLESFQVGHCLSSGGCKWIQPPLEPQHRYRSRCKSFTWYPFKSRSLINPVISSLIHWSVNHFIHMNQSWRVTETQHPVDLCLFGNLRIKVLQLKAASAKREVGLQPS